MIKKLLMASLLAASTLTAPAVYAQNDLKQLTEAIEWREEIMAYTIGIQAVVYGQPIVDYSRLMNNETDSANAGKRGYAPVNEFYNYEKLIEPGLPQARAPNHDTIYFRAWVDLSQAPLVITSPDTQGRYYNLDYVDFYSETRAHTGRRVTGTGAQKALLAGPNWNGNIPEGMTLVRLPTHQGIVFGRMLVDGPEDLGAVNNLIRQFKIEPLVKVERRDQLELATEQDLDNINFFKVLNRFLRNNPIMPGEEAMIAQFDRIGIGPSKVFDPSNLSAGTLRGLERAIVDGRKLIKTGRMDYTSGWSSTLQPIGVYGHDYLSRAAVEYFGLLGNMPEEAVYPRIRNDMNGHPLHSRNQYRIVLPKNMPVDAFWSLSAYNAETADLMPNELNRFAIGDRTKDLKVDGSGNAIIHISSKRPDDQNVNWLPVSDQTGFFLILRLYQPKAEVLSADFKLPPIQIIEEK